nr:hypothetical protein MmNV_44 [Menippe mercenaria nudivirus]
MNIYTEDTNLLRTHYYISVDKMSKYSIPISVGNDKVYIHKDIRGFKTEKFTHRNFVSLLRVLAFAYMRFKCVNIDEILTEAKAKLFVNEESKIIVPTKQKGYYAMDGEIQNNKCFVFQCENYSLDDIRNRNVWVFGTPDIQSIPENDYLFDYKGELDLCHFVRYINHTFKSDMISTILQNPLNVVFEEMSVKYYAYRIYNNIKVLSHLLFPSIYDFLTGQAILDYIKNVNHE